MPVEAPLPIPIPLLEVRDLCVSFPSRGRMIDCGKRLFYAG